MNDDYDNDDQNYIFLKEKNRGGGRDEHKRGIYLFFWKKYIDRKQLFGKESHIMID